VTASGTVDLRPTGPGHDLWSGGGAEQNPVNESEGRGHCSSTHGVVR